MTNRTDWPVYRSVGAYRAASGLLPFIDPKGPGEKGAGDRRIQTYCFRLCMTNAPGNRLPVEKPRAAPAKLRIGPQFRRV